MKKEIEKLKELFKIRSSKENCIIVEDIEQIEINNKTKKIGFRGIVSDNYGQGYDEIWFPLLSVTIATYNAVVRFNESGAIIKPLDGVIVCFNK